MTKTCSINECENKHYAKGFCRWHYNVSPGRIDRTRQYYRDSYKKHRASRLVKSKAYNDAHKGSIGSKLNEYRHAAKSRGRLFDLSPTEFAQFWQRPCYYCGDPIPHIGLDRMDNSQGYIISNIVSCCTRCNKMKREMNHDEFIALCDRIARRLIPFASHLRDEL